MNIKLFNHRLGNLLKQRNALAALTGVALLLNLIQASALLLRDETVVVVPADLRQEVWMKGTKVSKSYLEEMAILYADLILETTPKGAAYRREIILRNASPKGYGALKQKLLEEEKRLKKQNLSTSFQANRITVNATKLMVEVHGDLIRYVGQKPVSRSRDVYQFTFELHRGRLLITSFKLIKSDKNES